MHNCAAHLFVVSGVIGWPPRLSCRRHALDTKLLRSKVLQLNLHSFHTSRSKTSGARRMDSWGAASSSLNTLLDEVCFAVGQAAGIRTRHQRSIHLIRIPDAGYRFFAAELYDSFIANTHLLYVLPASFGTLGVNSRNNRQIRSPVHRPSGG